MAPQQRFPSHIKYYEPETDILLTNAIYRLVTPRDLPHMTPGAPLGHGQVMLGVHRLFFLHTIEIHAFYLSCANARVGS
jgi:hypothetical protein